MSRRDDKVTLGAGSIVCQDCVFKGEVIIGEGTVIHPLVKITALSGPIIIGKNNIIEELVTITNKSTKTLVIGDDNHFEVACVIESSRIGHRNLIESKSKILGSTAVGDDCIVAAGISTPRDGILRDSTVVYGDGDGEAKMRRRDKIDQRIIHDMHISYLHSTIPKFHQIKR